MLVLPFMIFEWVNRREFQEDFPIPLFGILWLLSIIFILTAMPIVRNLRSGNSIVTHPINLLVRVAILIVIAWMWGGILMDQMPCFMGVPNCD